MRLIDADKLEIVMFGMNGDGVTEDDIERAPTVNAIVIPDNATNGDVLQTMFPVSVIDGADDKYVGFYMDNGYILKSFPLDWWNAPYKKGGTEE